jgi:hypothetical protein
VTAVLRAAIRLLWWLVPVLDQAHAEDARIAWDAHCDEAHNRNSERLRRH